MSLQHIFAVADDDLVEVEIDKRGRCSLAWPIKAGKVSDMIETHEAVTEADGTVRLLADVPLRAGRRALVTILEEEPSANTETALLSEAALAEDWNRPEEDAAWAHLQPAR